MLIDVPRCFDCGIASPTNYNNHCLHLKEIAKEIAAALADSELPVKLPKTLVLNCLAASLMIQLNQPELTPEKIAEILATASTTIY